MRQKSITSQDTGSSVSTEQTAKELPHSLQPKLLPTTRRSRAYVDSELKSVQILEGFEDVVSEVSFSKSGKWLATLCSSYIHIWSVDYLGTVTLRQSLPVQPPESVRSISFRDGDNQFLAFVSQPGAEGAMLSWKVDQQQKFQLLQSVPGHCPTDLGVLKAMFSPNGLFFAVSWYTDPNRYTTSVYRTKPDGQLERIHVDYPEYCDGGFSDILFSDNSVWFFQREYRCYFLDLNRTIRLRKDVQWRWPITVSPSGGLLLSHEMDEPYGPIIVGLQGATQGQIDLHPKQHLEHMSLKSMLRHGIFSPDSRRIAGADDDGQIFLWEMNEIGNFLPKETLKGDGNEVSAIAFSPDGRWLLAASREKTIIIWDVPVR